MSVQMFPALDAATEAALRASIERFGVLVPVVRDQDGGLLDGHHRVRLAEELNVAYETTVREVADEEEAHEVARTLNEDRRHLTREQRREVVVALREEGHSYRAIGRALRVDAKTAWTDAEGSRVELSTPAEVTGLDGKSYPASRPEPEPKTRGRGKRTDPMASYENTTEGMRQRSEAQKSRLAIGLSEITGLCRGLADIDYGMVVSVCTPDEIGTWARKAHALARELRAVNTKLTEVSRNGTE